MLIRELRRLIFVVLPLLIFSFVSWKLYNNEPIQVPSGVGNWIDKQFDKSNAPAAQEQQHTTDPLPQDIPGNEQSSSGLDLDTPSIFPIDLDQSAGSTAPAQDDLPLFPPIPAPEAEAPAVIEAPVEKPIETPVESTTSETPTTTSSIIVESSSVILASPTPSAKLEDVWDVIYSISTPDKKYFSIKMGEQHIMNPNIIPHPSMPNTWIVVVQQDGSHSNDVRFFTELYCNAQFLPDGTLTCVNEPAILPIEPTTTDKCLGKLAFLGFNVGPHDARVFYGPRVPYTMYGSQSAYSCFGVWAQDLRELMQWGDDQVERTLYSKGTDLQRPSTEGTMEKNFFLFWDQNDTVYAHYDITPKRVFAKIEADGTSGPDLAPAASAKDDQCIAKYVPKLPPTSESIHQATNSLSITLCNRSDKGCTPTDENTVLFTIFQHKKFYYLHAVYEPYVMAFNRTAPFEIYGMSKKPIWLNGRKVPDPDVVGQDPNGVNGHEMIYVVSMNWKKVGQRYHGYLDDELFLSFGREDHHAAGIDILAGDLFKNLGKCD